MAEHRVPVRRRHNPLWLVLLAGLSTTQRPEVSPVDPARRPTSTVSPVTQAATPAAQTRSRAYAPAVPRIVEPVRDPYAADLLMVPLPPGADGPEVASRLGMTLVRPVGPSGIALLRTTGARHAEQVRQELAWSHPEAPVARVGVIEGAGIEQYQWHPAALGLDGTEPEASFSSWTVAVLDSGVAYESAPGHPKAGTLGDLPIVAPWDFIDDDPHPHDKHQHGTHIASSIVASLDATGIAGGVGLMPLRILDNRNRGNEVDLIDALHHAADHGADVVNMSLSFHATYAPSLELSDAIDHALDAGVVLLGAAGNSGSLMVTQPAAHPGVIAVGAATLSCDDPTELVLAPYSNHGPGLDVLAPGGRVDADCDGDGLVDGILAETIRRETWGTLEPWFMAGTSQATALASGVAIRLLASGVPSDRIRDVMMSGASSGTLGTWDGTADLDPTAGHSAGIVDLDGALAVWASGTPAPANGPVELIAGPSMEPNGTHIELHIRVDAAVDGAPAHGIAHGTVWYGEFGLWSCTLVDGTCTAIAASFPGVDPETGGSAAVAWSFTVDSLVMDGHVLRPDATKVLNKHGSPLVVDDGTGVATSPFSFLIVKAPRFHGFDGTGIATSPFGFRLYHSGSPRPGQAGLSHAFRRLWTKDFDGTGIATSPFGFFFRRILRQRRIWGRDDGTAAFGSESELGLAFDAESGEVIEIDLDPTEEEAIPVDEDVAAEDDETEDFDLSMDELPGVGGVSAGAEPF